MSPFIMHASIISWHMKYFPSCFFEKRCYQGSLFLGGRLEGSGCSEAEFTRFGVG